MDFKRLRQWMVERQIIARGVKDKRVIDAMLKVERHLFVPENIKDFAYEDRALPIGMGQTISQPYMVAVMTELILNEKNEKVLEIGTGSGYQTAILAEIFREVYTVEIIDKLSKRAESLLKSLGYNNIHFKIGSGYEGWSEHSPYDAVIVTCAPREIPESLIEQLKIGGRMVIPVGDYFQTLYLVEKKSKDNIVKKPLFGVLFVPMVHK